MTGGLAIAAFLAFAQLEPAPAAPRGTTVDELVALALGGSGLVTEAAGKVDEWRARLAEVESVYYPKLSGRGFVAPMYGISGESVTADPFQGVYRQWDRWGPYFHLEATLAQPLYTFGRAEAGQDAAENRLAVEEARARQTRNLLAFEVRKLAYLHLYARSIQPALLNARKVLDGAIEEAERMYRENKGSVTNVDLQQLQYGSAEIDKYLLMARIGESLSLAALKHTVGLPDSAELRLADEALPPAPAEPVPELPELLRIASQERPEWAQVRHGKQAAISLEAAERLANAPVIFAAGQIEANWAPTVPDAKNPYHVDPYNGVTGGVAVGLQFDLDPWKAKARGDGARALRTQVDGLEKFASTGIPLEVRKARDEAVQAQQLVEIASRSAGAGRKWMLFAASGYLAGTGEAKDVLEGLVAYLQARRDQLEQIQAAHTARAYLLYATGCTGLERAAEEPR